MKRKFWSVLALCLLLSSCTAQPAAPVEEPVQEAPVVTGETDRLIRTKEVLDVAYDFTHDGENEIVELVRVEQNGELQWYELEISAPNGRLLWLREAHNAHAGWKNFFACRIDGKDYILDYGPTMYQGLANYSFDLCSLTENGLKIYYKQNSVSFDVNFGSPIYSGDYDPAAVGAFMDDVHSYLDGDCTLLLSTDGSGPLTGGSGSDYRGDDFTGGELYAYDGTWEERFIRYRNENS